MIYYQRNKGIGALEALIALSVFTLIISALVSLFFGSENVVWKAPREINAIYQAHFNLKKIMKIGEVNFDMASSSTSTDKLEIINVTAIDNYMKKIESKIYYRSSTNDFISESAYLTNFNDAYGGSTCQNSISSDESWKNPVINGGIDLGMGNSGTDIFVRNKIAFLTANSASSSSFDFYIIDVHDPNNPKIISTLNTGPGIQALAVAGNYAYVGNDSINAQLQIIDISNLSKPVLVSSYKLPGKYTDGTTLSQSMYFYRSRIYLGTKKSQIQEFHVIDVSNPYSPQELGSFELGNAVNSILVRGNLAYIVSPNSEELKILDVSDLGNIKQVGGFDAPLGSGNGESLALSLNTLYLGRALGDKELYVLNTTSTNPSLIASRQFGTSIYGIVIRSNLGFFATIQSGKELQIFNMDNPQNFISISNLSLGGRPLKLTCNGNTLYALLQSNNALRIINPGSI